MAESQPDTRKDEERRKAEKYNDGQYKQEPTLQTIHFAKITTFLVYIENYLRKATKKRESRRAIVEPDPVIEHYKKLIHDLIDPDSKHQYEKVDEVVLFGLLMLLVHDVCTNTKHRDHKNLRLLEDFLIYSTEQESLLKKRGPDLETLKTYIIEQGLVEDASKMEKAKILSLIQEHETEIDEKKKSKGFDKIKKSIWHFDPRSMEDEEDSPFWVKAGCEYPLIRKMEIDESEEKSENKSDEKSENESDEKSENESDEKSENESEGESEGPHLYLSALAHATRYGNIDCVRILLDSRVAADPGRKIPLYINVEKSDNGYSFNCYDIALVGMNNVNDLYRSSYDFNRENDLILLEHGWDKILSEFQEDDEIVKLRYKSAFWNNFVLAPAMWVSIITITCLILFSSQANIRGSYHNIRLAEKLTELVVYEEFDLNAAGKSFLDIQNMEEFWDFVDGPFTDAIFSSGNDYEETTDGPGEMKVEKGRRMKNKNSVKDSKMDRGEINTIIGAVQIRQVKVKRSKSSSECAGGETPFYTNYLKQYSCQVIKEKNGQKIKYDSDETSFANLKSKYVEVANVDRDFPDYGHMHWNEKYPAAAGHIWDIGTHNRTDAVAIFKKMRESNWISPHRTRYVRLRFNVYNGNTNLFAVVELGIELWPTGGATTNYDMRIFDLYYTKENADLEELFFIFVCICHSLRLLLEIKEVIVGYVKAFENEKTIKQLDTETGGSKIIPSGLKRRATLTVWQKHKLDTAQAMQKPPRNCCCPCSPLLRWMNNFVTYMRETYFSWRFRLRFIFCGCCGYRYLRFKKGSEKAYLKTKKDADDMMKKHRKCHKCCYTPCCWKLKYRGEKCSYICKTCWKHNEYIRNGWNVLEWMIVCSFFHMLQSYMRKGIKQTVMQNTVTDYFKNETDYSKEYFPLSQYAYVKDNFDRSLNVLFFATAIHSLNIFHDIPFLGPRIMAITGTFVHKDVLPFYLFFLLNVVLFGLAMHFSYGHEIFGFRSWHSSFENILHLVFGDFEFSDGYEDMEESWPYGTNVLLIVLILVLTLFMMNVFIAVISSAYDDCLVEAAKYFEKLYIDVSFYKSRSKTMKRDVLKCYLKPIKKITSESLKVFAREIYSCGKETDIETLRRLLNHGNMELAAQISKLHRKIESIKK